VRDLGGALGRAVQVGLHERGAERMAEEVDLVGARLGEELVDESIQAREDLRLRVDREARIVLVHADVARGVAVAREAHRLRLVLGAGARAAVDEDDRPEGVGRGGGEAGDEKGDGEDAA
jgi:hypothetical protein